MNIINNICYELFHFNTIFYLTVHGTAAISFWKYLQFNKSAKWTYSLTLNLASSTINAFRHSFLSLLHFYGNQYHMKFYPSQLHQLLNINLNAFFFVIIYLFLVYCHFIVFDYCHCIVFDYLLLHSVCSFICYCIVFVYLFLYSVLCVVFVY